MYFSKQPLIYLLFVPIFGFLRILIRILKSLLFFLVFSNSDIAKDTALHKNERESLVESDYCNKSFLTVFLLEKEIFIIQ